MLELYLDNQSVRFFLLGTALTMLGSKFVQKDFKLFLILRYVKLVCLSGVRRGSLNQISKGVTKNCITQPCQIPNVGFRLCQYLEKKILAFCHILAEIENVFCQSHAEYIWFYRLHFLQGFISVLLFHKGLASHIKVVWAYLRVDA